MYSEWKRISEWEMPEEEEEDDEKQSAERKRKVVPDVQQQLQDCVPESSDSSAGYI